MGCINITGNASKKCIDITSSVPKKCIEISSNIREKSQIRVPAPEIEPYDSGCGHDNILTQTDAYGNELFVVYELTKVAIKISNYKEIKEGGFKLACSVGAGYTISDDGVVYWQEPEIVNPPQDSLGARRYIAFKVSTPDGRNFAYKKILILVRYSKVVYENTDGSKGGYGCIDTLAGLFDGNDKVKKIVIREIPDESLKCFCRDCNNLEEIDFKCDTSIVTNMEETFEGCSSLKSFPEIDTSNVTNFDYTWDGCSSLTTFPAINTSNATNLSFTWRNCSSLTSFPTIDTSNITNGDNLNRTWYGCSSLQEFPSIDTSNIHKGHMYHTWDGCSSLTSFPAISLDQNNVTLDGLWNNCTSLQSFPHIHGQTVFNNHYNNISLPKGRAGYISAGGVRYIDCYCFDDGTCILYGTANYVECDCGNS